MKAERVTSLTFGMLCGQILIGITYSNAVGIRAAGSGSYGLIGAAQYQKNL